MGPSPIGRWPVFPLSCHHPYAHPLSVSTPIHISPSILVDFCVSLQTPLRQHHCQHPLTHNQNSECSTQMAFQAHSASWISLHSCAHVVLCCTCTEAIGNLDHFTHPMLSIVPVNSRHKINISPLFNEQMNALSSWYCILYSKTIFQKI